jgi:cobalt-zinc-cadmium efflux system outer membrane protein
MSIQHWFFCTSMVLTLSAWGQAPEAPAAAVPASTGLTPVNAVTLAQALQAARNNLDVSLTQRAFDAARADVLSADRAPTPVLTAKTASIDLQNGVGPGNALNDKRIDKSIGMDWTWERGNKRELRTRGAQRAAQAAQADLDEALVQQQLAAAGAYYDLLAAQERITQVQAIALSAAELARTAQRRLRAGDLSQQDAARSDIEAERANADLRAAQADRVRAELTLKQVTRLSGVLAADAAWPAPALALPDLPEPQLEARPDVRAAVRRTEAAQAVLESAEALRQNDLTLGTSFDHYPGTSTRLLEFRVQMPLAGMFGNYGYQGELGRATAQLAQAQDLLDKTRLSAALDIRRLQQDLLASSERALTYQNSIVPRARQVASMAELAYGKGAMSLTELLDARRTLRAALLEDVATRADHARSLAAWQLRSVAPAL